MANSAQRRARVRLARQRPSPNRVRTRTETGRPLRWWHRIPWVHLGAVVGALAAIGGLVFTGIATYYSGAVADDQLQQSRDDAEQDSRSQAKRVTFWTSVSGQNSDRVLHVANRSPDPITNVRIYITILLDTPVIALNDELGPCTERTYSVASDIKVKGLAGEVLPLGSRIWQVRLMTFTDSNGQTWKREVDHLDSVSGPFPPLEGTDPRDIQDEMANKPKEKRAEPCSDEDN